ncbi:TonB-dependent receptor [Hymenobacter latericus]|uniref:TonB-dependent receptor n=1 Tax=Hymenobacter sp. YIM 151858-1 TaxID=2987688 RepID=UPI00222750F9|nr:TonB-dependent receptor [Hymenobacter sp. YIM 151858-1]UYZ58864.1 TonB-dependent receptor [Hymenobacter sp. YIM 151858-1]
MYAFTLFRRLGGGWATVALWLGASAAAQAQRPAPAAPPDTARHVLPAVQVQAQRPTRYAAGSRFTVLDSAALVPFKSASVADALSARTPLYLRTYGPGQLATLSIRGTSGRHTAVLWNGFSVNFPTLGEADMALLPVASVGQVSVQHGPAAALYGTGAMGGAVVLGPAAPRLGQQVSATLEAGSFGYGAVSFEGSHRDAHVAVQTSLLVRSAENNFPYTALDFGGPVRHRQASAALQQSSFTQQLNVQLSPTSELTASAWFTRSDRQIQPAIGSADAHARQQDESGRLVLGYRRRGARSETAVRAARFADNIRYYNDQVQPSNSATAVWQAQAEHTLQWRPNASLRLGAEAQHFVADVDGYRRHITEQRYAGIALLRYDPTARLRLTLNARQAVLPGRRAPLAPTLGTEYQLWRTQHQQLWLKANAARSYRAPTLNERYWGGVARPDLRPETGVGYESGLHYEGQLGTRLPVAVQADLTAYHLLVDNWVEWIPAGGVLAPRNVRRVRSRGIEASTQAQLRLGAYRLSATAAYAYTQARKVSGYAADLDPVGNQLRYVPLHSAAVGTQHGWRNWQLALNGVFTGYRYTTASADDYLPGYALLHASAGRTVHLGRYTLTGLVQGYNLTNQSYQNYAGRAMPGRSGMVSLRLGWH